MNVVLAVERDRMMTSYLCAVGDWLALPPASQGAFAVCHAPAVGWHVSWVEVV